MTTSYELGPFRLDPVAGVLMHGDQPTALGARAVAVLHALISSAPGFVSKDRLFDAAWPGLVVEESNLSVQISAVRRALSAVPGAERWLETLPRRGYRYAGPLTQASAAPSAAPAGAPAPEAKPSATNLTEPLTSFIGRQQEAIEVQRLLQETRLLTLLGTGGVGKTRLALHAAGELLPDFADGVWLVELAALADPALVPQAVATVLGFREQPGKPMLQTLINHLREQQLLLVLDNAEHLVQPCAELADALLRQCPQLRVLVTSRERLAVEGETSYRVPSLPVPAADASRQEVTQAEAVQLFVERARLQMPGFTVSDANAPVLARLCARLDGIALAIELAAARIRSMTVLELLQRLDQRFRVLTGGSRTAPRRQQTLRALIDWSYDLLSDAERALLQRLSVFAGGCALEAAEDVCSGEGFERWELLDLLTSLADKNLLTTEARDGTTRYGMLESVREYAAEQLALGKDAAHWKQRHLDHFVAKGERAEPHLIAGSEHQAWADWVEVERDNLHAALAWALGAGPGAVAGGLRLTAALALWWSVRGHGIEEMHWVEDYLQATPDQATRERALVLTAGGFLGRRRGEQDLAMRRYERSIEIVRALDDRRAIAAALLGMGAALMAGGDYAAAKTRLLESLDVARSIGDDVGLIRSLIYLGILHLDQGEFAQATQSLTEGLTIASAVNYDRGVLDIMLNLGAVAVCEGRWADAREVLQKALDLARRLKSVDMAMLVLVNLATAVSEQGDLAAAAELHKECLVLARRHGNRRLAAVALYSLGEINGKQEHYTEALLALRESVTMLTELKERRLLAAATEKLARVLLLMKRYRQAAVLVGWAAAERKAMEAPITPSDRVEYDSLLAGIAKGVGDVAEFDSLMQQGADFTLQQGVDHASTEQR